MKKVTELTMKLRITNHDSGSTGTGIEIYRDGGFVGISELSAVEVQELVSCAILIREAFEEEK